MSDIAQLTDDILKFRRERGWHKAINPKDIAMYVSVEAGELLEHFLWRHSQEQKRYIKNHKQEIADEIGDVFYLLLLLSHVLKIDIAEAQRQKLQKAKKKYPVKRGSPTPLQKKRKRT